MLRTLRPGHPRLLVLDEQMSRVKENIAGDAMIKAWFERIKQDAIAVLDEPVCERKLLGPRLLQVSKQVLNRVTTLAGIYRLTGDKRYADRARDEMLAAAGFVDWNPSHFLDVAEMTNALAIGYDWLFDQLTPEQRTTIRTAIVEKGLNAGLKVYESQKGWPKATNNWNQVCNGGLTVGALAVADEEPEVARKIIENARASIVIAMKQFEPDGGYVEGPAYWGYATRYTVFYLAALETALGTDFGYLETPGLAETGMFRIHATGPIGRTFNFADAGDSSSLANQMFWFASVFDRPVYAAFERQMVDEKTGRVDAFHLYWFNDTGSQADVMNLPRAALFERINVVFLRSAWNDRNAAFVGFKGGDNAASHAHLDLGSFVYDADGIRWAYDLGPDDYNLPAYFGTKRWDYYRLRTEGQNTLTIDGENQNPKAVAEIIKFSPDEMSATADLSAGYAKAHRVVREVKLAGKQLTIRDEVQAENPVEIVWHMHTETKIEVKANRQQAILAKDGKELIAQIVEPATARFEISPADPPPAVRSTAPPTLVSKHGGEKLTVRLPEKVTDLKLVVSLSPITRRWAN